MNISKTQRWLDLIVFLVRRHFPVPVDDIMNGVPAYRQKWNSGSEGDRETVRRMFERDKDELRAAGIPLVTLDYSIDYGAETAKGYRLADRDFYLPYLKLVSASEPRARPAATELEITGDEAVTAVEALRRVAAIPGSPFAAEARSALRKLSFDLDVDALGGDPITYVAQLAPAYTAGRAGEPIAPTELQLDPPAATDPAKQLRVLNEALRRRKRVRFEYHGIRRGQRTERDVAPYGLLYQHGHWYLIGHDATRDATRVFRVARMGDAAIGPGTTPEYDIPPDVRIADYAARDAWELGDDEPIEAHVRIDFPLALWAERNGRGERLEELAGGAHIRRFHVRQTAPFLRWLQQFGGAAVVLAPAELRRAQLSMARETLAVYDRPGGPSGEAPGHAGPSEADGHARGSTEAGGHARDAPEADGHARGSTEAGGHARDAPEAGGHA
jgi:proteasome accessory factor B